MICPDKSENFANGEGWLWGIWLIVRGRCSRPFSAGMKKRRSRAAPPGVKRRMKVFVLCFSELATLPSGQAADAGTEEQHGRRFGHRGGCAAAHQVVVAATHGEVGNKLLSRIKKGEINARGIVIAAEQSADRSIGKCCCIVNRAAADPGFHLTDNARDWRLGQSGCPESHFADNRRSRSSYVRRVTSLYTS